MDAKVEPQPSLTAEHAGRVIRLEDVRLTLSSRAGPVDILRGLELAVTPGESVGIVGPSGSGKTTLLMVVAGLEAATSGIVEVAGHDLNTLDEDALARFRRDHIGIVFQAFHLIATMTALENVAVPLEFMGRRDAFAEAQAQLKRVGLADRTTHYPGQLSGGEQQRVAIARALAAESTVLLADEPTGNLDQDTGADIIDLLFGVQRESNTTLLLVTHDPKLAQKCNRIVSIRDGQAT